ncbi:MAG: hypothetical protein MI810_13535 [Flavobacteriales bacterium]|nr:hypothetical protein [Flavobacteriales bacterium]
MKYIIGIGLLLCGILIGFFIGQSVSGSDTEELPSETAPTEFITEYIRDTIVQEERVEIRLAPDTIILSENLADTSLVVEDSLGEIAFEDTLLKDEDEIRIKRERLIEQIKLPLIHLSKEEDKDTTIKELLGIEDQLVHEMSVEFWESPLNFSGYKLSKKKLVLYGMSPQLNYTLYKKDENYYLLAEEVLYVMKESQEFLNYVEISREEVFND